MITNVLFQVCCSQRLVVSGGFYLEVSFHAILSVGYMSWCTSMISGCFKKLSDLRFPRQFCTKSSIYNPKLDEVEDS
jgi:hypothetical protein